MGDNNKSFKMAFDDTELPRKLISDREGLV